MSRRWSGCLLLVLVVWRSEAVFADEVAGLPQVAKEIAQSEAQFTNCEFTTQFVLEQFPVAGRPIAGNLMTRRVIDTRTVIQGACLRVESTEESMTAGGAEKKSSRQWMFDGEKSREVENRERVKITVGPIKGQGIPRLHRAASQLTDNGFPQVPLSTILSGLDAVRAECAGLGIHSYDIRPDQSWTWELLETDHCDELVLEHLRCTFSHPEVRRATLVTDVWLSKERQFVVKTEQRKPGLYGAGPYAWSEVTDWGRTSTGLWYPARSEMTVLDTSALLQKKKTTDFMTKETVTIEVKSLRPDYAHSYFQEPDLKQGAIVEHVRDEAASDSDSGI
jgi:hypothetical protein